VALGLAVALAIAVVSVLATTFSLGSGRNDYEVKVHFPTANGLIEGSDVFFGGVKVGTVASVVVDQTPPPNNANSNFQNPTQTASITVSIGKQYAPLHQGATAAIRPKSLLGEKYVAMTVGDPGKDPIPDGATLPPDATSVNVELDQLINIFDKPTRDQLQKLIDNLGTGLAGQGRNTNETFQTGATDLTNLASVTDILQARDVELRRVIEALTKITQTLSSDQQRANYPDLLAHSDTVLKTLIAEDADVASGIDRMNTFFGLLDQGLAGRQQDFNQIITDLPVTVSSVDALASVLGPQGHVTLGIVQAAAPGVVGGDLIFGSQPDMTTYTNAMYTRVMPAQGCYSVGTRTYNANGYATDNQSVTTRPGTGNLNPDCTSPAFANSPCALGTANPVGAATCLSAVAGSLCVLEQLPPQVCNLLTQGSIGAAAPSGAAISPTAFNPGAVQPRGPLGLPLQQSPDNPATQNLIAYLLR
jgi:virulence factor Mce-like protein